MVTVDVGDKVTLKWALGTAGATVTVAITNPDGTTLTPALTVTEPTQGNYEAELTTVFPGRHIIRWTTAGAAHSDILNVWPADPRFIISFDEAVAAVGWGAADVAARGDDLRLHMASATEVIEDLIGAVLVRTVVQLCDGGKTGVALWERPDEILGVEVDGEPYTDYVANLSAAIVYAGKDPGAWFPEGRQIIEVTYRTGMQVVPPSIRDAVRILLQHMVSVEQSPNPMMPGAEDAEMDRSPSGFLVPRRVAELCRGRRRLAGIA